MFTLGDVKVEVKFDLPEEFFEAINKASKAMSDLGKAYSLTLKKSGVIAMLNKLEGQHDSESIERIERCQERLDLEFGRRFD